MQGVNRIGAVLALLLYGLGVGALSAGAQVVVGQPQRVLVRPGPVVVAGQPVIVRPGYNAYQDALGRLRSKHANSRRDGAVTLGRIGDPQAVPDLVWLLQNDWDGDVRTAAAFALGAIGDARAASALRHASMTDRNKKVRQAANHGFGKIMFQTPVLVPAATTPAAVPTQIQLEPVGVPVPELAAPLSQGH